MVAKRAGKIEDPKVRLVDCLQAILTTALPGCTFVWRFQVCGHGLWAQSRRGPVQGVDFSQAALRGAYAGLRHARKKDGHPTRSDFALNKDGDRSLVNAGQELTQNFLGPWQREREKQQTVLGEFLPEIASLKDIEIANVQPDCTGDTLFLSWVVAVAQIENRVAEISFNSKKAASSLGFDSLEALDGSYFYIVASVLESMECRLQLWDLQHEKDMNPLK
ncbi:hypothetical protein DUI87_15330 [Hirundo rustica rustica]|uniref:Uncharacterized protein n=1 Tax=Hirundo rustica rustica TaxID=333673 RepID=A0A3M0K5R4_HIRRU|nr:hypothetical protein DUI87_15330 [Hirundo rustica rustica]